MLYNLSRLERAPPGAHRGRVKMRAGGPRSNLLLVVFGLLLAACGPQLGSLEQGEEGQVVRAYGGDTLELDSCLRVFLAEIDAPRGDEEYATQAQGELEALALHRKVRLAYGGTRRWTPRVREGDAPQEPPPETAIAHVFAQSEGGRWFWLQHELIAKGAAFVRPRRDNHARSAELLALEAQARAGERGLWAKRAYQPLNSDAAAEVAREFAQSCLRGAAPYRMLEARIDEAQIFDTRASLTVEGQTPFSIVVFGENFSAWDGPALASLTGAHVRARGSLGMYRDAPQLCLEHASQLEVLPEARE